MSVPKVFEWEVKALPRLKKIWKKIKQSALFVKFRKSKLNPYHRHLPEIEADTLEKARERVRRELIEKKQKKGQIQFLYKGTRYSAEKYCSVDEEYKQDGVVLRGKSDVSDLIPRDKNGNLDLFAEDPIAISVIPMEGPALVGHVCMQYKDRVVNRLLPSIHTDPLYLKYGKYSEYYFIYPSKLGIDEQKLIREMDKYNIKHGADKYNFLVNNCAKNVADILKKVGVKDIDFFGIDKAGIVFPTPGNNPYNVGIKAWCYKHGVHVHINEMAEFNERYPIDNVRERRDRIKETRTRYEAYKKRLQLEKTR